MKKVIYLLICFIFVILISGIFIFVSEYYSRIKSNGNEEAAYINLSSIVTGAYDFRLDNGYYPKNISELASARRKDTRKGGYILSSFVLGKESGYNFTIIDTSDNSVFLAVAQPTTKANKWTLCVAHNVVSGKPTSVVSPVRYDKNGKQITTLNGCLELESVGFTYH